MTIQDLFAMLVAKVKFIIIMAIIGGVAAFCVADFLMPIKYSTAVKTYVSSSTNASTGGDTTATKLTTARTLAETYVIGSFDDWLNASMNVLPISLWKNMRQKSFKE